MTDTDEFYEARLIRRRRATKRQVEARRAALIETVEQMQPMTVRQVFYQATVRGLVEKTEGGYTKVLQDLIKMRKAGEMPYGWLVDNTRQRRVYRSYDGIEETLEETARFYRKDLWRHQPHYVEVWLEKDALSGVIDPILREYDVPLMVARGYASLSFLNDAAEYISDLDTPAYIYHFGDYDPSGQDAARNIEEALREMAPYAEIHFERIAVTPEQIERWNLPTRPTKATDRRSKNFGEISVELDAIDPDALRALVKTVINRHLPEDELKVLKVAEVSEREALFAFVRRDE
jgi:hypothetical protein